jgi:putative glycosyltransferase (TIGR04372 family)
MIFVKQQLSQIRSVGGALLLVKLRTALLFTLAAPVCLPLILIVRIIRPVRLIRFTVLPSKLIGHAVFEPEIYLSRKALGLLPEKNVIDLYYFESTQHSNKYWKKIIERHLPVSRFFYYLHRLNKLFPGWQPHYQVQYAELHSTADPENLLGSVGPQIQFNDEEEKAGEYFLRKMGIPKNAKFVCVQVRDSAHDSKLNPVGLVPSYNEFRNSDINNYVQAFEYLTGKGYWIIRMGKVTNTRLQTRNPKIIDYSNSGERTELLDVWLCFNCTFMISTGSGIDALAAIARKPIVCVDYLAYLDITYFFRNSLIILKHLYDAKSGRKLPLEEIIQIESQTYYKSSEFYWSRGIEWKLNTSQEIEGAVREMVGRLENSWQELAEDSALHDAAGKIIASSAQYQSQYKNGFVHKLGAQFLREIFHN